MRVRAWMVLVAFALVLGLVHVSGLVLDNGSPIGNAVFFLADLVRRSGLLPGADQPHALSATVRVSVNTAGEPAAALAS